MIKTKHALVVFGLTTVLLASNCSKNEVSSVPEHNKTILQTKQPIVSNNRLLFNSQENLIAYLKENMRKKIIDQDGFTSLSTALKNLPDKTPVSDELRDLLSFGFPQELLSVLNSKGEVRIGDEIVWYHSGKKYYIPVADESKIDQIKQKPESIDKFFDAKQIKLQSINPNAKTDIGLTATDSRYIKEFYLWGTTHTRFVHEASAFIEGTNVGTWIAYSVIRLKLEWKDCCKWNPATTIRDVSVNLTGSANLYNGTGTLPTNGNYIMGPSVSINVTDVVNSDYVVTLAAVEGYGSLLSGSHWTLRLDGSIYQYAQGDYLTNAWTNTATPMW
ncbi:hypothetical protein DVR12_18990 [Chitinophaga silvatica]|uniref:Uncharacterized protein n=1 Tax=Chitinophaga silvatica TaxID=2282649 RepID=A0A3E1Y6Y0_9BACT|nr:hypothetical protein [Chitinophaga silvatica]RFS20648.1 hypothetical protein DVR12_18990 [Chitinophaga silvatica]